MDAGGLAGSENFPLFRPDHSPRDTLGRTRAPRPGSPDVRSALALGCSSAATRRLRLRVAPGPLCCTSDSGGTPPRSPATARQKSLRQISAGGEPANKKSGRGPPTKATPSAQDPARRPEKNAAGESEAKQSRAKMLGPSGEFVELRVSGVRRLQRDLLSSRRRPAAPSDAPRCRPTVGRPRTPAPHTGTSCPSTSCGLD